LLDCPASNDGLIVGAYVILLVLIIALYFIPSVNSSITKILAYYIQIIQIVVFPTSSWILETYSVLNLRLSNWSFCLGPLSYYNRFLLDMLLPILCAANIVVIFLIAEFIHRLRARVHGNKPIYNRYCFNVILLIVKLEPTRNVALDHCASSHYSSFPPCPVLHSKCCLVKIT
jgi:hypothetical protein